MKSQKVFRVYPCISICLPETTMYLSYSPSKSCFFAASRIARTYTIITPATWRQDISSAPEWKQQWLQHNQKLSAPLQPTGRPPTGRPPEEISVWARKAERVGGKTFMASTWLDVPFFPTQPILEFGYVWILLFVLLNVTSAGKIHRCLALQSRAGLCWWRYRMVQGREFGFWPFRCGDGSKFSTERIWKRHDKTSVEGPWVSLLVLNFSMGT